jgi:ribosomal protein S18 acetylase RimI-like enzyme
MDYRQGDATDLEQLKQLALLSWSRFKTALTAENWERLYNNLGSDDTYLLLLAKGKCIICEDGGQIVGMAFWIPSGHPDEIYQADWSQIRFVTVSPDYSGQGIGKKLTEWCIEQAKLNNEQTIALHTSEMMDNARHIYESMGFAVVKELAPRLGKRYWLYTMNL